MIKLLSSDLLKGDFVFLSSRSVLYKESKGGALLAENSTPNGGDGVPDQRGDP